MNIYLDLFETFDRIGISSSPQLYEVLSDKRRYGKITEDVTDFFVANGPKIVDDFLQSAGNRLVFYDADGIMGTVSKKALLYSQTSLFISNNPVERDISYDIADSDGEPLSDYSYLPIALTMMQDLFALKPLLLNGVSVFLPGQIFQKVRKDVNTYNTWTRRMGGVLKDPPDEDVHLHPNLDFSVPRDGLNAVRLEASPKGVMEVLSGEENVHPQLTDSSIDASGLAIRLFLPTLSDIPMATLLKLREDENDTFIRFQHALSGFFKSDPKKDGPASFVEMLESVDYEIRVLNNRFDEIKRKSLGEVIGLSIMTIGLLSLYLLPSESSKLISQISGITTIPAIVKYITSGDWSTRQLQDSDFYYAWKVGKWK